MFVNEKYQDYKYLVEVGDNYVVLTNRRNVYADYDNPATYRTIIQYLYPSYITFETTNTTYKDVTFEEIEVSNNYWDRADVPFLFSTSAIVVFLICIVINTITEFIQKGGLFK